MACTRLQRELMEFERVFQHLDEDGDGKISQDELRRWLRTIDEESSAEQVELLLDGNGESLIGFDEFMRLVGVVGDEEGKIRELREAFWVFVMDGEGCITAKSLRRTLSRLGWSRSLEDCMVMIQRFDINGDGVLSFEEFRNMML
ncbi:putative calcium-binding protein CML19 [Elaeis guineensis]|uniref:putative calcium-binding protein CML19 n=1 Tax=Elaeis guineensis var. tenera TaxID=51953 RepID=UPI003C6CC648